MTMRDRLQRLVERVSGLGMWTWDPAGGLFWASDAVFALLGVDRTSLAFTVDAYLGLVHPSERDQVAAAVLAGIRSGTGYSLDHRIVRADGAVRWLHSQGESEVGSDGSVALAVGTVQDVTEVRSMSGEVARARDLFAGVLNAATEQSIIGLDPQGVITVFNSGAERMLGFTAAEMIGVESPPELHEWAEVQARAAELGVEPGFQVIIGRAAGGEPETRQWTYVAKDGRRLQVMITTTAVHGADGRISGFIKVATDITARVVAEQALGSSEALFETVFDQAPYGMLLADTAGDTRGRMVRVNPALCRITGRSAEQLLAMPLRELTHPEDRVDQQQSLTALSDGASMVEETERRWIHADGRDIWVQASASAVLHRGRRLVIGMVDDITARKDAEHRLSHLALHDALTGLPNRLLLMDRLEHALAASRRSGRHVAVYFIDLDGFKVVNDVAGHLVGDEVLLMVAQRLTVHVRPGDTVARMGGDEFVVVCPGFESDDGSERLAQRLVDLLARTYTTGGVSHHLSASIGVAVSVGDDAAEDLLRAADDAMYAAKAAGKNRARRHSQGGAQLGGTARAARHLRIEGELAAALDRGELVMHGQPVLGLPDHNVIAVETLIRWNHPERGVLPPAEFLDVAENSPLMIPIGRRVLEESCRIAASLTPAEGHGDADVGPAVFVNISGRQLEAGNLKEDVLAALDSSGLPASRLVLELTETTTPLITGSLMEDINDLRDRGVRLAIDDVGTGYSSLARFTELPVDILKIDRGFVARIGQNNAVDAVVKAILSIGESLKLQIVAEGVETVDQERLLDQFGCRIVQGYLYSHPRPEPALHQLADTITPKMN